MPHRFTFLRRTMALGLAATIGMAAAANAESWRLATKMPPDSPEGKAFQLFADKVGEYSCGELTVRVYPSEQLGKTAAILEQIQAGTVHVYTDGTSYLSKWVPEIKFMSSPFLFESREHWSRFMKTDLVQGWLADIEKKAGVALIGDPTAFMRGPYRVMVTRKPWKELGGVKGLKLRMHPDQLAAEAWTHLGAEVRVLGWTEVYSSIKRGIVQAVNSPIALVEAMKFYEVAPHIIRHNEYPQGIGFMVNAKAYRELSPKLRKTVDRAHADASAYSVKVMMEVATTSIARMKAKGVTYEEPTTDDFVASMAEFYKKLDQQGKLPKGFIAAVNAARSGS